MPDRLLYLAYGSNLHPGRLCRRTPSARTVGCVALPDWELAWTKRGADGSGKCTLVPAAGGVVHGAVFTLAARERAALDRAEGAGYAARELAIPDLGRVFFYLARSHYLDGSLFPFCWYRAYVVQGARYHGFPAPYVRRLEAAACREDPDAERAAGHAGVIARLAAGPQQGPGR